MKLSSPGRRARSKHASATTRLVVQPDYLQPSADSYDKSDIQAAQEAQSNARRALAQELSYLSAHPKRMNDRARRTLGNLARSAGITKSA